MEQQLPEEKNIEIQLSPTSRDKKGLLSNHSHLMSFAPIMMKSTRTSASPRLKKQDTTCAYISPRAIIKVGKPKPAKLEQTPIAKDDSIQVQNMYKSLAKVNLDQIAKKPQSSKKSTKRPMSTTYHRIPEHDGEVISFLKL